MGSPIYSLSNVQQQYNGRLVLNIDQLTVHAGEVLAIVGPSGAGKSTLLRLLAFLEQPAHGALSYAGHRVDEQWPDLATRRQVTLVFQRPHLLHRSVQENVGYGLGLRAISHRHGLVTAVLQQLGLAHLARAMATALSGGEMQRVALARALVLRPRVLLLDEPTANLDPYNITLIEQLVTQTNQTQNVTVIMVTHNIFQARRLAHRVALLLDGRLVEVCPTELFFTQPQNPKTAAFARGDMIY